MHYYLVIAVKLFCLYHAYKNNKPYHWYFVILFIPIIGALIYIITQVYTKSDATAIQSEITAIINPTKKVRDLEHQLQFSDSYTNRIALADAHFENKDFKNAKIHYKKTLEDKVQDDTYARQQLVYCCYKLNNFEAVIKHSEKINNKSEFKNSKAQFYYGLSLKETGDFEKAEAQLAAIDKPYSNYEERLLLAKFYLEQNEDIKAKNLLNDISEEADYMTKPNRRLYRTTIAEVQRLLKTL